VREAGRLAEDHSDAGTAVAARAQLLDAALIEHGRGRGAILHEDLGELAAPLEGGPEDSLQDVLFYEN
jgi:hypothetical protein